MSIDLNEIRDGAPLELDLPLDLPNVKDDRGKPLVAGKAHLRGQLYQSDRGVEMEASLRATVRLECGRCLEPCEVPLDLDFELTLVNEAVEYGSGEAEVKPEDASLYYTEGHRADPAAIAAEQIHLNLPLKPVCGEDCRGLCPTCGANRNRLQCSCRQSEVDPRLAPLLELKKRIGAP